MIRAALAFFALALISLVLGATGIAGLSMEIAKTLLFVFLVLAVLSFIGSLFSGNNKGVKNAIK